MNRTAALLAEAQELLDSRRDPFENAAFCQALEDAPEALEEIVALRAVALPLQDLGRIQAHPPSATGRTNWSWIAMPMAAALLLWATLDPRSDSDTESTAGHVASLPVLETSEHRGVPEPQVVSGAMPPATTPAILQMSHDVRTQTHHQKTGAGILQVKITSSQKSANS